MTARQGTDGESGHARYTYRLRVSSTARAGLMAEWARCRWVWNECVAMSRKVHGLNRGTVEKTTCGPAQLDKLLTEARAAMAWLREGASVPYASFVVETAIEPLPETGRVIGIDWGVKETATTTSDSHDLPHPQHGKTAAAKPARYQKQMARRKPARGKAASKGYRTASRAAAKVHKKVARQRQDTGR
ncbi:transposase, partial [Streptomyces aureus]|uniref:transposase n=1 Tax=Streptomyces aureus TaxID=193461 RepID=UPI001FD7772E